MYNVSNDADADASDVGKLEQVDMLIKMVIFTWQPIGNRRRKKKLEP